MGASKGKVQRVKTRAELAEPASLKEFTPGRKLSGRKHVVGVDGGEEWLLNGKLHRLDGPARTRANGDQEWWVDDRKHREDGPAVECANGHKEWWKHDRRHREDGPAVEWADGRREWWIDNKQVKEEDVALFVTQNRLERMKLDSPEKVTF